MQPGEMNNELVFDYFFRVNTLFNSGQVCKAFLHLFSTKNRTNQNKTIHICNILYLYLRSFRVLIYQGVIKTVHWFMLGLLASSPHLHRERHFLKKGTNSIAFITLATGFSLFV